MKTFNIMSNGLTRVEFRGSGLVKTYPTVEFMTRFGSELKFSPGSKTEGYTYAKSLKWMEWV